MKNNYPILILCFSVSILLTACSPSLMYSPALSLTGNTLKKDQVNLSGGIGLLPETRPHATPDRTAVNPGANMSVAYGFSSKFNLQLNGWIALNHNTDLFTYGRLRTGFSLQSRISIAKQQNNQIDLVPGMAILFDGNTITGYGFEIPIVYLNRINDKIYFYTGGGFAAGTKEFNREKDFFQNQKYPYGMGIIGHLGLGYNIVPNLKTVLELCPIIQLNRFDGGTAYLISPTLSIGYTFK